MDPLVLRHAYFDDPAAFLSLRDLLQDVFGIDIGVLSRLGGVDPSSVPFGYFDADGHCVANFSMVSIPLLVNGEPLLVAGYQSGAVRPDHRGRGLYRDVMRRAFAWAAETGHESGLLMTDKPELYTAYGFRTLPQHRFDGQTPTGHCAPRPGRLLDMTKPDDIALVSRLLDTRLPVSQRFSVLRQRQMFLLNACLDPEVRLTFIDDAEAIVAWRLEDGDKLTILDCVASVLPPLADLIGAIGYNGASLSLAFSPDRFVWPHVPQPHAGQCVLMASGRLAALDIAPFMLSPMAEF